MDYKEKVIALLNSKELSKEQKEKLENIFPELKSKDERIRKTIYGWIYTQPSQFFDNGFSKEEMLAWVKKQQGKSALEIWKDMRFEVYQQASGNRHEPNYSDDSTKMFSLNDIDEIIEKISEKNPVDKIEPKFHEGDWITHNTANFVFKIINVGSNGYEVVNRDNYKKTISFDCEDNYHLWSIADAKDGDVLVMYDIRDNIEWLFLYRPNPHKLRINDPRFYCHYDLKSNTFKKDADYVSVAVGTKFSPATEEQRDLLFQKMKEAGYEWNNEKKELKKIESKKIEPKKLDAVKVIAWLVANICDYEYYVKLFKKDFEL